MAEIVKIFPRYLTFVNDAAGALGQDAWVVNRKESDREQAGEIPDLLFYLAEVRTSFRTVANRRARPLPLAGEGTVGVSLFNAGPAFGWT